MDVRCEKCQTVYEFDDSKVTAAGVTVKCTYEYPDGTRCNNLFRVRRRSTAASPVVPPPGAAPQRGFLEPAPPPRSGPPTPPPRPATPLRGTPIVPTRAAGDDRVWLVRSANGEVKRFRELTTLQQWIVERKVSRDDEISRSGETWKRLGGIAELASFFSVVEQAEASQAKASPTAPTMYGGPVPTGSQHVASPSALASTSPSLPAVRARDLQPLQPILEPSDPDIPMPPELMEADTPPAPSPNVPSFGGPSFGGPSLGGPSLGGPSLGGPSLGGPVLGDGLPELDEIDHVPRPRLRGPLFGLLGFALAAAAVVGVVAWRRAPAPTVPAGDRTGDAYQLGREQLLLDSDDALRAAEQDFQRAHAANMKSPEALAARAEVSALVAWRAREDAKWNPARAEELEKLARERLEAAKRDANQAARIGADHPDVARAMAALLLVDGAPAAQVESFLKRCEERRPDDAEAAWYRGALALREGKTDDAVTRLEQANRLHEAKTQRSLFRADLLLARIGASQGRREYALALARKVVAANPRHERALALLAQLEAADAGSAPSVAPAPAPKAAPAAAAPKAATVAAPPPVAVPAPKVTPVAAAAPKGAAPVPPPPVAPVEPRGATALVATGNRLLERGKAKEAQKLFEKALAEQPNHVEAMSGLAYCLLDTERYGAAADKFKQVLQLAPNNGDALLGLGQAYKMRGDKNRALEYYRKYIAELPSGSKVRMARANVEELEAAIQRAAPSETP